MNEDKDESLDDIIKRAASTLPGNSEDGNMLPPERELPDGPIPDEER